MDRVTETNEPIIFVLFPLDISLLDTETNPGTSFLTILIPQEGNLVVEEDETNTIPLGKHEGQEEVDDDALDKVGEEDLKQQLKEERQSNPEHILDNVGTIRVLETVQIRDYLEN